MDSISQAVEVRSLLTLLITLHLVLHQAPKVDIAPTPFHPAASILHISTLTPHYLPITGGLKALLRKPLGVLIYLTPRVLITLAAVGEHLSTLTTLSEELIQLLVRNGRSGISLPAVVARFMNLVLSQFCLCF